VRTRWCAGALSACLLAACGGPAPNAAREHIIVPPRATLAAVTDSLVAHAIVTSTRRFRLTARILGTVWPKLRGVDRRLRPGRYEFPVGEKWTAILNDFVTGRTDDEFVTVPEGSTIAEGVTAGRAVPTTGPARRRSLVAAARTFVPRRTDAATGGTVDVGVPDHVDVLAETADGVSLRFQVSAVTGLAPSLREAWLFGSEGTLRVDADSRRIFAGRRGDTELKEIVIPEGERVGWRVEREFVGAIRGSEPVRFTTFADGVRCMAFTEAVAVSAREGRRVDLPTG
jgi:hypothetical protein